MRPKEKESAEILSRKLEEFERQHGLLPGIEDTAARETFIEQLIESIRRIKFVEIVRSRRISLERASPSSNIYDPVRAAILLNERGETDEAAWQIFLSVHFGHSRISKWVLPRDIYGRLGSDERWGWREVQADVTGFRQWLNANQTTLKDNSGVVRRFGNHRKYTSLDAWKPNGTGDAVASYVDWVNESAGHQKLFGSAITTAHNDPKSAFTILYNSMKAVRSFGRTARFDYLTMIGKTGIALIDPDSPYMNSATGPLGGAKLLFGKGKSPAYYNHEVARLGHYLDVNMQVMEDTLCNWQKSPEKFIAFRG